MENENAYPGFIRGFKASNISSNKSSLLILSEQITKNLDVLEKDEKISSQSLILANIKESKLIMGSISTEILSPSSLIEQYIKFGNLFMSIINSKIFTISNPSIKTIVINYLKIAKYSKDKRIDNIAIDIAKSIDQ